MRSPADLESQVLYCKRMRSGNEKSFVGFRCDPYRRTDTYLRHCTVTFFPRMRSNSAFLHFADVEHDHHRFLSKTRPYNHYTFVNVCPLWALILHKRSIALKTCERFFHVTTSPLNCISHIFQCLNPLTLSRHRIKHCKEKKSTLVTALGRSSPYTPRLQKMKTTRWLNAGKRMLTGSSFS